MTDLADLDAGKLDGRVLGEVGDIGKLAVEDVALLEGDVAEKENGRGQDFEAEPAPEKKS